MRAKKTLLLKLILCMLLQLSASVYVQDGADVGHSI